jgi:transcriptional regulator with XRE-family HTH domain
MTNGEILGSKLQDLRKSAGMSQEDLAERLGISRQAVSRWERGDALPDTDNLIRLSKLYSVSLDELVGNTTAPQVIRMENSKVDNDEEGADYSEAIPEHRNRRNMRVLRALPYPILVTVIFLALGFLFDAWAIAWTLYLTIPLYYNILDCLKTKRFATFAYPIFITFIYLVMGMAWHLWHPLWVLYITIPIYYAVAEAIDRRK